MDRVCAEARLDPFPEPFREALRELACEVLERNGMKPRLRGRVHRLRHNAAAVLRYLESWHKIEPGTGTNDRPINRKERGEGRPPMSDPALMLSKKNEDASRVINPILAKMLKDPSLGSLGNSYADLLAEHIYNPGALRTWRGGLTLEDREKAGAFWELCLIIAQRIEAKHGDLELSVISDPKDAEADNPIQARNRDNNLRKKRDANYAYELIYEAWREWYEASAAWRFSQSITEMAAKEIFREWYSKERKYDLSPWKLYAAIRHCEGNGDDEAA